MAIENTPRFMVLLLALLGCAYPALAEEAIEIDVQPQQLSWYPADPTVATKLKVAGGGLYFEMTFAPGEVPMISLNDLWPGVVEATAFRWELRALGEPSSAGAQPSTFESLSADSFTRIVPGGAWPTAYFGSLQTDEGGFVDVQQTLGPSSASEARGFTSRETER